MRACLGYANGLSAHQEEEWQKCGLAPKPFTNVTYLYPFKNQAERGYSQSFLDIERDDISMLSIGTGEVPPVWIAFPPSPFPSSEPSSTALTSLRISSSP